MIELRQEQVAALIAHAREEFPNECCGLILGRSSKAERIVRGVNTDRSPMTYTMDSETLKLIPKAEDEGLDLVGLYHSHTHTRAYPSPTDVSKATYPGSYYIIVSLQDPDLPEVRAFRITDRKDVSEASVIIR